MELMNLWEPTLHSRAFVAVILVILLSLSLAARAMGYGTQDAAMLDEENDLRVAITRLDRESFPKMTAYLRVMGPDGRPLDDLAGDQVQVIEDGANLSPSSVTLLKDDSQPVDVVLALDVAVSPETLQAFQGAARAFVEAIGSKDRVALLAFHDAVEVAQPFTNGRADLRAAVDGLATEEASTALNAAIYDAAAMADARSVGHTAVVVLAGGGDAPDAPSRETAIERARRAEVPVYLVGLGDDLEDLSQLAEATGGWASGAASSEEVTSDLLEALWGLRRGYQVRFQSGLEADRASHTLTVRVDHAVGSGEAETMFLAATEAVSVTPLGITSGQVVSGVVELDTDVTAPASVVAVEYLLNGESLGERYEPPYRLTWDTRSLAPGSYILTSKAMDRAGNKGLAHVDVQVVPLPLLQRGWVRYVTLALLAGAIFGTFALGAVILFLVIRWQWVRYQRVCRVTVRNLGNVPSRYRLRAEDSEGLLRFQFVVEGANLRQRQVARVETGGEEHREPAAGSIGAPDRVVATRESAASRQPIAEDLERVQEKSRWALNVGRTLADTLGAVGALLPPSLGAPFKRVATQMRQQQAAVSRLERVPRQTVERVRRVPRKISQIEAPNSPPSSMSTAPTQAESGDHVANAPARAVVDVWAETPVVAPGDELALDLLINPVERPAQERRCTFAVISQTMVHDDAPSVVAEGEIRLRAVSWFRHVLPFLGLGLLAVVTVLGFGLLVRALGLFG